MKKTWILVADSSKARLFTVESASGPLIEVRDFLHPESRMHEQELTTDLPGKHRNDTGVGAHGFEQSGRIRAADHRRRAQIPRPVARCVEPCGSPADSPRDRQESGRPDATGHPQTPAGISAQRLKQLHRAATSALNAPEGVCPLYSRGIENGR